MGIQQLKWDQETLKFHLALSGEELELDPQRSLESSRSKRSQLEDRRNRVVPSRELL